MIRRSLLILLSLPMLAHATPPPGTEALGRGGAMVARSDSPLGLLYNMAGVAQAPGTQVLADVTMTQFGELICSGERGSEPCSIPVLAVSTDLNLRSRWRLALGVAPEAPLARHGITLPRLTVPPAGVIESVTYRSFAITPRAGVAVRALRDLYLGLAIEDTILRREGCASLDDAAPDSCTSNDAFNLRTQVSALLRLRPRLALGLSLRSANNLGLTGDSPMPWELRLGARYIHPGGNGERFDIELDGGYRGTPRALPTQAVHNFSARLGGGLRLPLGAISLALRAGLYTDVDRQFIYTMTYPWPYSEVFPETSFLIGSIVVGGGAGMSLDWGGGAFQMAYGVERDLGRESDTPVVHSLSLGLLLRFSLPGKADRSMWTAVTDWPLTMEHRPLPAP